MMKKILILVIALALGISAGATAVTVGLQASDLTVYAGDAVTIDLISDTACTGIDEFNITADAGIALPANGIFNGGFDWEIIGLSTSLDDIEGFTTSASGPITAGIWIFRFDVVVNATGDVILGYDPDWVSFFDGNAVDRWQDVVVGGPLTITVIPEPMTIALLGLGGLLLRRRK